MLAVKMTYSVSNPTLILVGSLKYDIKKYSVVNLIGSIGWAAMLIGLGHAFGKTAFYYLGMLRRAGFIVFFIVASLVALVILKESGNLALSRITGGLKDDKKV